MVVWIKVNNGETFEGTLEQFQNCFFSNATLDTVLRWADDNKHLVEISNSYPYGRPPYDPKYGDDRMCKCGHRYYRHFDTYDRMSAVGCKYCPYDECEVFTEA